MPDVDFPGAGPGWNPGWDRPSPSPGASRTYLGGIFLSATTPSCAPSCSEEGPPSEEAPLLLIVSRFHPEKRLGVLFKAFREAIKQRPMGLVVYCAGYLSKRLRRLAEETPGLVLAGYTKDREELAEIIL